MAIEDIGIRYKSDVSQLEKDLEKVIALQDDVVDGAKEVGVEAEKAVDKLDQGSKEHSASLKKELAELNKITAAIKMQVVELNKVPAAINKEVKELGKLKTATDKAFSPKPVIDLGKEIDKTADKTVQATKKTEGVALSAKNIFGGIAASIAAAFSVQAIISFGKASIDGFLAAEKASERLRFNIITLGKNSEAAFDRLEKQAEKLEGLFAIDADNIKEAQGALAAFGLTADEIEAAIPKLADFATVTGVDIVSAAQQVGAGLEGAGREFKKYGIEVSATASRQENLNSILGGFETFAGAAENATKTLSGSLEQTRLKSEALKDEIGAKLAPAFLKLQALSLRAISALAGIFGDKLQSNVEKTTDTLTGVRSEFNLLIDTLKRGNLTTEGRIQLIDEINTKYGQYLPNLLTEKSSLEEIEKAQLAVNKSIEQRILLISLESEIEQILKNSIAAQKSLISVEKERTKLQNDLSDNSTVANAKREQLNQTEALANAIIEDGKKRIDDLKNSYAELAKQLGISESAVGGLTGGLVDNQIEAAKLAQQLRDLRLQEIKEIGALRDEELKAIKIRDAAFFKSIEDRKKKIQELADLQQKAQEILTAQFLEEASTRPERERQGIAESYRVELTRDTNAEIAKLNNEAINADFARREEIAAQIIILNKDLADKIAAIYKSLGIEIEKTTDDIAATWLDKNKQIINASAQLVNEISALYSTLAQRQIESIELAKDAELSSIDEQLKANEEALEKGRISEVDAAKAEKELLDQKLKAEQEADKKIRDLKRKQFLADRAAALANIAIKTAENIVSAGGVVPLIVLYAAIGAAQAAIVLAQPVPYRKGSKDTGSDEHLSMVGEDGPELMMMKPNSKVLSNPKTKKHAEIIDAMFDNRLDKYIFDKHVSPAMMKYKAQNEMARTESFATNIAKSVYYQGGLTPTDLEQSRRRGQIISNADQLAESIAQKMAQYINNDPYRR